MTVSLQERLPAYSADVMANKGAAGAIGGGLVSDFVLKKINPY